MIMLQVLSAPLQASRYSLEGISFARDFGEAALNLTHTVRGGGGL